MKILQKTTWMRYLFIGLIINCIFFQSCTKIRKEYIQKAEFVYINETNYTIRFPNGMEIITLNPKQTIKSNITVGANEVVNETTYNNTPKLFDIFKTFNIVFFNDLKCLDLSKELKHNPSQIKDYVAEKIGDRTYKFTYTFTEADYNRAVACP